MEMVREADEEHPGHRTQANEEAGSIVSHVGHDMNEKEKNDRLSGAVRYEDEIMVEFKKEETNEAAVAKRHLHPMRRFQRKTWKSEDSSMREETHPRKRNSAKKK